MSDEQSEYTGFAVAQVPTSYRSEQKDAGEVFSMAEDDFRLYERTGLVASTPAPNAEGSAVSLDGLPEWPLAMDPEKYLEKFPTGPNAALARSYVAAAAALDDAADDQ